MIFRGIIRGMVGVVLPCVLGLAVGCGLLSETYHAPQGEEAGTVVLVNRIYPAGFNVWVDKKKAAFLDGDLAIRVEPGHHKIKLESKCTSLRGGMKKEEKRTFEYEVQVDKGQTEQVLLAWGHSGYEYKEGNWERASKPKPTHPADAMSANAFAPGAMYPKRYPGVEQWGTTY